MLATLQRLDPRSDRIDLLVDLVEQLRPRRPPDAARASNQVRTLCQLLKANPMQAASMRTYLSRLLDSRRHASLYTDIGILSNDGFVTELKRRIAYRVLPPALGNIYLADAIDQVLYKSNDHVWINAVPVADWLALYDVIALAPAPAPAPAPGPAPVPVPARANGELSSTRAARFETKL